MLSEYFDPLYKAYRAELEDLETNSEGKNVLSARLEEKRGQLAALLPMMDFAPEMVAPIFHGACSFLDAHAMVLLSFTEPDDFPAWETLEPSVAFESWAKKYVVMVLNEPGGERFLTSAVCLEFLHETNGGRSRPGVANAHSDDPDTDDTDANLDADSDAEDLDDAGADWLADQGFDRRG